MNLFECWRITKRETQLQMMALFFILFNKSYLHDWIRYLIIFIINILHTFNIALYAPHLAIYLFDYMKYFVV